MQGVSGAKSEQVPVEQFPGERQRGQGHQGVVDAPPCAPEVPPPRQDDTDDTPNGQDRRDECQRKQRGEQGRHTTEDDQITGGAQPDQEEPQPDQEEHVQRTEHPGQPADQPGEELPTRERRLSLLIGGWCLRTFTVCLPARLRALRTSPHGPTHKAQRPQ